MKKAIRLGICMLFLSVVVMSVFTGCTPKEPVNQISPEQKLIESVVEQCTTVNIKKFNRTEGWEYNVYEEFVEILKYTDWAFKDEIVIPSTLEGLPVRVLDSEFIEKSPTYSRFPLRIVIPETVVYVKSTYFTPWDEVEEFIIDGDQLIKFQETTAKDQAWRYSYFRSNDKLTNENIQHIIDHLYDCIPRYMFYQCSAVKSFALKDNIKVVGEHAFSLCENLEKIDLGYVEKIEEYAFSNFGIGLDEAIIRNPECSIGSGAFDETVELYGEKDSTASSYAAHNRIIFNEIQQENT